MEIERDYAWCVALVDRLVADLPKVRKHEEGPPRCSHEQARYFFGRGWAREFVAVAQDFLNPLHIKVRSNAHELLGFERAVPEAPEWHWWKVTPEQIDPDLLAPAIRESFRLCQLRNQGRPCADPLRDAHMLLLAGLESCDPSCWPAQPFHLGGPKPTCSKEHQEAICDWCVELLRSADLATVPARLRPRVEAMKFHGPAEAVRLVTKAYATDASRTRAFLASLDQRILVGELAQQRGRYLQGQPASSLRRVLWRGTNSKGFLAGWIAELDGDAGGYGLLAKRGQRWAWSEGDRDSVLATVPDALFASAVASVSD